MNFVGAYKTRLYRALGYDTFEECCEQETEASKSRVDRLIGAATVCEILTPIGGKIPAREAHARPLTALRNGEDKLDSDAILGSAPCNSSTARSTRRHTAYPSQ